MNGYHILGSFVDKDELESVNQKIQPWLGIIAVVGLALNVFKLISGR